MPSNIVAYEWPLNATAHIAYETDDTHIHEIVVGQDRKWRDNDITFIINAPKLEEAILAGFTWEDGHSQQIAYASAMREMAPYQSNQLDWFSIDSIASSRQMNLSHKKSQLCPIHCRHKH